MPSIRTPKCSRHRNNTVVSRRISTAQHPSPALPATVLCGSVILWIVALCGAVRAQEELTNPIIEPKQYVSALTKAETILLVADLRLRGRSSDPGPVLELLARRLREIDYATVSEPAAAHDVSVVVQCQEHGVVGRPTDGQRRQESDALQQVVHGPPCRLSYAYDGKPMKWQRVDRVVFTLGVEAARAVAADESSVQPMRTYARFLERYDFPILLAAEWGQTQRLCRLLAQDETSLERKRMILFLLGETRAENGLPCVLRSLEDDASMAEATAALGSFGTGARAPLIELLRTSPQPEVQAAAARSLGNLGATTGDWSLTSLYIEMLNRPDLDMAVQIELVWAVGKNPDRRALPVLERLYNQVWSVQSDDPQLREFRAAIDWSHRGVRLGGHTDEY